MENSLTPAQSPQADRPGPLAAVPPLFANGAVLSTQTANGRRDVGPNHRRSCKLSDSQKSYARTVQQGLVVTPTTQKKKLLVLERATTPKLNVCAIQRRNASTIVGHTPELVGAVLAYVDKDTLAVAARVSSIFFAESIRHLWRDMPWYQRLASIKPKDRRRIYALRIRTLCFWPAERMWVIEPFATTITPQVPLRRLQSLEFYPSCTPPDAVAKRCMTSFLQPTLRTLVVHEDEEPLPIPTTTFRDKSWVDAIASSCIGLSSLTIWPRLRIEPETFRNVLRSCKRLKEIVLGFDNSHLIDGQTLSTLAAHPRLEDINCQTTITQVMMTGATAQTVPTSFFPCLCHLILVFEDNASLEVAHFLKHCRSLEFLHMELRVSNAPLDFHLDSEFFATLALLPSLKVLDIHFAPGMELFAVDLLQLSKARQLKQLRLIPDSIWNPEPYLWIDGRHLTKLFLAFQKLVDLYLGLRTDDIAMKYDDYIIVQTLSSSLECFYSRNFTLICIDEPEYFDDWPITF